MNGNNLAVPAKQTVVAVSATAEDGTVYSQDFPVSHPSNWNDGMIIGAALQMFRQSGGILMDNEGGVDFYMAIKFKNPVQFRIKNIVLASQIS